MDSTVIANGNSNSLIAGGDIKNNQIVFNILESSLEYTALKGQKATYEQLFSALKGDEIDAKGRLKAEIANIEKKIAVYTDRVRSIVQTIDQEQHVILRNNITRLLESQRLDEAIGLIPDEDLQKEEIRIETQNKALASQYLLKAKIVSINYQDNQRIQKAKRYFNDSIRLFESFENLVQFGQFLIEEGFIEDGIRIYEQVTRIENLEICRKIGVLHNLIDIDLKMGDYEMARASVDQIIDLIRVGEDVDVVSLLIANSSLEITLVNYAEQGLANFPLFEEFIDLRRSLTKIHPEQLWPFEVRALGNFCRIFLEKGHGDKAMQYFRESLESTERFLFNAPFFPTILQPTNFVFLIVSNLKQLALAHVIDRSEIDAYYDRVLKILAVYEGLVKQCSSEKIDKGKTFLAISVSYSNLAEICKEKEIELLNKAMTFFDELFITQSIADYSLETFRRLAPTYRDNVKEFYRLALKLERFFPYIDKTNPTNAKLRDELIEIIDVCKGKSFDS